MVLVIEVSRLNLAAALVNSLQEPIPVQGTAQSGFLKVLDRDGTHSVAWIQKVE